MAASASVVEMGTPKLGKAEDFAKQIVDISTQGDAMAVIMSCRSSIAELENTLTKSAKELCANLNLLLDEATQSLVHESELLVQANLREKLEGEKLERLRGKLKVILDEFLPVDKSGSAGALSPTASKHFPPARLDMSPPNQKRDAGKQQGQGSDTFSETVLQKEMPAAPPTASGASASSGSGSAYAPNPKRMRPASLSGGGGSASGRSDNAPDSDSGEVGVATDTCVDMGMGMSEQGYGSSAPDDRHIDPRHFASTAAPAHDLPAPSMPQPQPQTKTARLKAKKASSGP